MRDKIHTPSKSFPRLVIERSEAMTGEMEGFLEISSADKEKRIGLGNPDNREYRLVQCLFNPKNFMSAKYEPVVQTYERLFGAIVMSTDSQNMRLAVEENAEGERAAIVEKSLRNLRRGEIGKHFAFVSNEGRVNMVRVG